MSKPEEKTVFLTLEDLLKGTNVEVPVIIPADRFSHLPNLAGKIVKIRPLSRLEYRAAFEIADKQGYTAAINMLVFKALTQPKFSDVSEVDKAVGGIIDWLINKIHGISGMEIEAGGEEEKNLTESLTP